MSGTAVHHPGSLVVAFFIGHCDSVRHATYKLNNSRHPKRGPCVQLPLVFVQHKATLAACLKEVRDRMSKATAEPVYIRLPKLLFSDGRKYYM